MSPDWSDIPVAVPFADLSNPQSLNLYAYVNNNPLGMADPDGHEGDEDDEAEGPELQTATQTATATTATSTTSASDAALMSKIESRMLTATEVGGEGVLRGATGLLGFLLYTRPAGDPNEDRILRQEADKRVEAAKRKKDEEKKEIGKISAGLPAINIRHRDLAEAIQKIDKARTGYLSVIT